MLAKRSLRLGATFDLWRTLISEPSGDSHSPIRHQQRIKKMGEVFQQYGISTSSDKISASLQKTQNLIANDHLSGKDIGFYKRMKQIVTLISSTSLHTLGEQGLKEMCKAIDTVFLNNPPLLIKGALKTVETVKSYGFTIGIISNTGLTSEFAYRVWLDRVNLLNLVDSLVLSNHVECSKPSKRIFDIALSQMQVKPSHCIHIGDNPHADVYGANQAGITTVLVNRLEGISCDVVPQFEVDYIYEVAKIVSEFGDSILTPEFL